MAKTEYTPEETRMRVTAEQILAVVEQAWSLLNEGYIYQARSTSEQLVKQLTPDLNTKDKAAPDLSEPLTHLYYVTGYSVNLSEPARNALSSIQYFREMVQIAEKLQDATLAVIALSAQAQIYCRIHDAKTAQQLLNSAVTRSKRADPVALTLYARAWNRLCTLQGEWAAANQATADAQFYAQMIDPNQTSFHAQYVLGLIYIDNALDVSAQSQHALAQQFLQIAETALPAVPYTRTLLTVAQGCILVRSGAVEHGMPLLMKTVPDCRKQGSLLILDQVSALQQVIAQQATLFTRAATSLADILYYNTAKPE